MKLTASQTKTYENLKARSEWVEVTYGCHTPGIHRISVFSLEDKGLVEIRTEGVRETDSYHVYARAI